MKIRNFKDLNVWQTGKEIVVATYRLTENFPRQEQFGLTSQMRRAAVSIPSNVAEGFNRLHNREYRQFLFVSLGSCAELETQVELATALGFAGGTGHLNVIEMIDHESRMLRNLIKRIDHA